jgi:hypothetical protein
LHGRLGPDPDFRRANHRRAFFDYKICRFHIAKKPRG